MSGRLPHITANIHELSTAALCVLDDHQDHAGSLKHQVRFLPGYNYKCAAADGTLPMLRMLQSDRQKGASTAMRIRLQILIQGTYGSGRGEVHACESLARHGNLQAPPS